jgi:NAD(P)-dependent dehydrogenase (short-subunit alcohol dehydrogenase family)
MVTELAMSNSGFAAGLEQMRMQHALARFGEPTDVGQVAAYLWSEAVSFVSGVPLPVDGGYPAG